MEDNYTSQPVSPETEPADVKTKSGGVVHYVIEGVLLVAVAVLFYFQFSPCDSKSVVTTVDGHQTGNRGDILPVAYVNVDSLLMVYNYAKDINEALLKKQENARLRLNDNMRVFQNEMTEFQKKVENNAFLSRERAESEQNRLVKKEQELRMLDQRLTQELMVEQQKMNQELRDDIYKYLREYNKTKGYQVIFSNTANDNILIAAPCYDITNEIVEALNKQYKPKAQ